MEGRREERTKEMIRQFPKLREEKKTIQEIADIFGLSRKTVYSYLQEIADSIGVTREDLLYEVQKHHDVSNATGRKALEQVDVVALENHFSAMIDEVDKIIIDLNNMLQENDEEKMEEA